MGNKKSCHKQGSISKEKCDIIEPKEKHLTTIIFLHGLGDTGLGWSTLLKKAIPNHCKLICPYAPVISVTLNDGLKMPAWFDIYDMNPESPQDERGIKKSTKLLENLIEQEIAAGIPPNRILIGGFSQGGAIALYTAITGKQNNLAGVIGLSTWLPLHRHVNKDRNTISIDKSTPILQCHGTADMTIPIQIGMLTSQLLNKIGLTKLTFQTYKNLGHTTNDEELKDVENFFREHLNIS